MIEKQCRINGDANKQTKQIHMHSRSNHNLLKGKRKPSKLSVTISNKGKVKQPRLLNKIIIINKATTV